MDRDSWIFACFPQNWLPWASLSLCCLSMSGFCCSVAAVNFDWLWVEIEYNVGYQGFFRLLPARYLWQRLRLRACGCANSMRSLGGNFQPEGCFLGQIWAWLNEGWPAWREWVKNRCWFTISFWQCSAHSTTWCCFNCFCSCLTLAPHWWCAVGTRLKRMARR